MIAFYPTNPEAEKLLTGAKVASVRPHGKAVDSLSAFVVVHAGKANEIPRVYATHVVLHLVVGGPNESPVGARVRTVGYTNSSGGLKLVADEALVPSSSTIEQQLVHAYREACQDRANAVRLAQDAAALTQVLRRDAVVTSRSLVERATHDALVHTVRIQRVCVDGGLFSGQPLEGAASIRFVSLAEEADLVVRVNSLRDDAVPRETEVDTPCIDLFQFDTKGAETEKRIQALMARGRVDWQAIDTTALRDPDKLSHVLLGVLGRMRTREDVVHRGDASGLDEATLARDISKHVGNLQLITK